MNARQSTSAEYSRPKFDRSRLVLDCPLVLFLVFMPGILIAGEAYATFWIGQRLVAAGILVVLLTYSWLVLKAVIGIRNAERPQDAAAHAKSLRAMAGALQLLIVGGAFLSVFAPSMIIGALTIAHIDRKNGLFDSIPVAYLASVLTSLAMASRYPWLQPFADELAFNDMAAFFFGAAFVFGVQAFFISREVARQIGSEPG